MNLFRFIPLLFQWGGTVVSAVVTIESLFGSGLSGAEKKERVMAFLSKVQKDQNLPWGEDVLGVIGNLIDTVVGILNFTGLFRRGQDASDEDVSAAAAVVVDTATVTNANVAKAKEQDPELAAFLDKMKR